ncbi:MAG: response regulator [Comamonadaceae bacterium]|nr:response regulator [Comamonadaceae bacterium]
MVEDEAPIAMDLSEQLAGLGYEVCGTAMRGDTALQRIAELRPDLVLMDVKLSSSMDGVEVAQQLGERYAVPIVFLTAYSDSQLIARARRTSCYGLLVKPFEGRELHATLQVALARFRALR